MQGPNHLLHLSWETYQPIVLFSWIKWCSPPDSDCQNNVWKTKDLTWPPGTNKAWPTRESAPELVSSRWSRLSKSPEVFQAPISRCLRVHLNASCVSSSGTSCEEKKCFQSNFDAKLFLFFNQIHAEQWIWTHVSLSIYSHRVLVLLSRINNSLGRH